MLSPSRKRRDARCLLKKWIPLPTDEGLLIWGKDALKHSKSSSNAYSSLALQTHHTCKFQTMIHYIKRYRDWCSVRWVTWWKLKTSENLPDILPISTTPFIGNLKETNLTSFAKFTIPLKNLHIKYFILQWVLLRIENSLFCQLFPMKTSH